MASTLGVFHGQTHLAEDSMGQLHSENTLTPGLELERLRNLGRQLQATSSCVATLVVTACDGKRLCRWPAQSV